MHKYAGLMNNPRLAKGIGDAFRVGGNKLLFSPAAGITGNAAQNLTGDIVRSSAKKIGSMGRLIKQHPVNVNKTALGLGAGVAGVTANKAINWDNERLRSGILNDQVKMDQLQKQKDPGGMSSGTKLALGIGVPSLALILMAHMMRNRQEN